MLPTTVFFGPEAAGGVITCVNRHPRWFLAIPLRRSVRGLNMPMSSASTGRR